MPGKSVPRKSGIAPESRRGVSWFSTRLPVALALSGTALAATAQTGPGDWGWRRFEVLDTLARSIARDQLPRQDLPFHVFVNWRQLDGDGLVDAIVLIKSARSSCASPSTRCLAAVITTGQSANGAGDYGLLGQFYPQGEPLFINMRGAGGVQMWIPESRGNYVAVTMPRTAGQAWQTAQDRVTQRQAMGTAGTIRLDEDDFVSLDAQRRAIEKLRARSPALPPPGGAPFLYSGEENFFDVDPAAKVLRRVLDRMAGSRVLDRTPTVDATPCVGGSFGSVTSFGQYIARSNAGKVREMEVSLCNDRLSTSIRAENEPMLKTVWNTRLWFATMQVIESIDFQELRQAADATQLPREVLAAARTTDELQRWAEFDFDHLMSLRKGLEFMVNLAPTTLASETAQFEQSRFQPATVAIVCAVRAEQADPESQRQVMQARAKWEDLCPRLNRTVAAMR